jgi:DNA mismatch endonuclease (patch repair protein)
VVLAGARIAVFCDGDFWHGRDLASRVRKLAKGHNAPYWVAKIRANVLRDRRHDRALHGMGWLVIRLWESDILANPVGAADRISRLAKRRRQGR